MHYQFPLSASARVVKAMGTRLSRIGGRQAISLTPAAVSRIKELVEKRPGTKALKVFLNEIKNNNKFFRLVSNNGVVMVSRTPWNTQMKKENLTRKSHR